MTVYTFENIQKLAAINALKRTQLETFEKEFAKKTAGFRPGRREKLDGIKYEYGVTEEGVCYMVQLTPQDEEPGTHPLYDPIEKLKKGSCPSLSRLTNIQ